MPLFDYHCETCFHEFEALQAIGDEPMVVCPRCEASTLKKKPAAPAFTLKGSGWYKDLYGSPGSKSETAASAVKETTTSTASPKPDKTETAGSSVKGTDS